MEEKRKGEYSGKQIKVTLKELTLWTFFITLRPSMTAIVCSINDPVYLGVSKIISIPKYTSTVKYSRSTNVKSNLLTKPDNEYSFN